MARTAEGRRDGLSLLLIGLAARLAMVAWAWGQVPPTADGGYYHALASRLAAGEGYTWAWPDGVVTYAAHYPIGYPALLALGYRLLGASAGVAMLINAVVGASAVWALHASLANLGRRRLAFLGGLLVAIHPGLVAYTPALMTEGVAAALMCWAAWGATRARAPARRGRFVILTALALGAATLVRPQCLIVAPALGALAWPRSIRSAALGALVLTVLTLACCLPWTLRNCRRMNRCALVSVNGGWNLLIGTQAEGHGGWSELQVPVACREVFDEAAKDECFERAARETIRSAPARWLGMASNKLSVTFDYCGAAGWYLHEANGARFPERAKFALGVVETAYERTMLLLALLASLRPSSWRLLSRHRARSRARRGWLGVALASIGVAASLSRHGWVAYVALLALLSLRGRRLLSGHPIYGATLAVVLCVASVHAVFFGAGRYQVLVLPMVAALAALGLCRVQGRLQEAARRRTSA